MTRLLLKLEMLRNRAFGGLFIMKKDVGEWEYMSKYSRRKDKYKFEWSSDSVKYFSDATIKDELAWKTFAAVRESYPDSRIILYARVNNKVYRVKYYDPKLDPKTVSWYSPSDFYAYIPQVTY